MVARVTGAAQRGIDVGALAALDVRGRAVLLHTGDDARFGTADYPEGRHFLTRAGAAWLAGHDAALVGIDALDIDDTADGERPAHTLLLAVGIPVAAPASGATKSITDPLCRSAARRFHSGAVAMVLR